MFSQVVGPPRSRGDDVIEVQIFAIKNFAAVLAGVFVALKNIMPRELHFLLRQTVIHEEQDDARHADAKRRCRGRIRHAARRRKDRAIR